VGCASVYSEAKFKPMALSFLKIKQEKEEILELFIAYRKITAGSRSSDRHRPHGTFLRNKLNQYLFC